MVAKKQEDNTIEQAVVEFKVKRVDGYELWRQRSWGITGKTYMVLDAYPSQQQKPVLEESLTDMLTSTQLARMGATSYYLAHAFAAQPDLVSNRALEDIDVDIEKELLKEITRISAEVDEFVIVTGSMGRRFPIAMDRIKKILSIFKKQGKKVYWLTDPHTKKSASPTHRGVRQGGKDWVLEE